MSANILPASALAQSQYVSRPRQDGRAGRAGCVDSRDEDGGGVTIESTDESRAIAAKCVLGTIEVGKSTGRAVWLAQPEMWRWSRTARSLLLATERAKRAVYTRLPPEVA